MTPARSLLTCVRTDENKNGANSDAAMKNFFISRSPETDSHDQGCAVRTTGRVTRCDKFYALLPRERSKKIAAMFNHTVEFVSDKLALTESLKRLDAAPVIALDIETIYWWDRESERVSLIQLAFRENDGIRVVVIDALADFDP